MTTGSFGTEEDDGTALGGGGIDGTCSLTLSAGRAGGDALGGGTAFNFKGAGGGAVFFATAGAFGGPRADAKAP